MEAGTCGQGARCAVGAGDPFAKAATDGQRLATPGAVVVQRARQGLEEEVIRRLSAAWTCEPEGRKRHHGELVVPLLDIVEAKASGIQLLGR